MNKEKKNLIQSELKEAEEKYKFEEYNGVKALCHDNVVLVEAMILNDSRYANIYGKNSKTRSKIKDLKNNVDFDYLESIIKDINKQNSTHASDIEMSELADRLLEFNKKRGLIKFLCNPDKDFSLIKELAKGIKTKDKKNKDRERTNFSLATKICQTLCFVLNENNEYQDNFMKFDNVLRKNLPKYLKAYQITVKEIVDKNDGYVFVNDGKEEENFLNWLYKEQRYSIYMHMINLLLKKSGNVISKNGLDHLIWYTNK